MGVDNTFCLDESFDMGDMNAAARSQNMHLTEPAKHCTVGTHESNLAGVKAFDREKIRFVQGVTDTHPNSSERCLPLFEFDATGALPDWISSLD